MTIPFEPRHGLVIVSAELCGPNGSTVLRMALDTGAMSTLINATPLEWVGYNTGPSSNRLQITTGRGVEFAPEVMVQRLAALGQTRTDLRIVCHTLPPSANVDGLLGLDFLRNQRLIIDFRAGDITLD